jgi:hypothetical protein
MLILFLLGCQGRALASPIARKRVVAEQRHGLREGWEPQSRDPQSRFRDLKGLGSRQPGPNSEGRARKTWIRYLPGKPRNPS